MALFKKRAKAGFPDPNGPLSLRVPSDENPGGRGVFAESAASEGKKCHTIGK